jgi:hypothetical protein
MPLVTQSYPLDPEDKLSYTDVMRRLCKISLDIVQQRSIPRPKRRQLLDITEHRNQLLQLISQSESHLVELLKCKSMKEQLQYWNLYLHQSYTFAELCRPCIRTQNHREEDREAVTSIKALCIKSLADTVEAFLGLANITKFATQSWAAVHRSLSSALLLGILGEPSRDSRVASLLTKLSTVMSNVISSVDSVEITAPLARSVAALQHLVSKSAGTKTFPGSVDFGFGTHNFTFHSPLASSRLGSLDSDSQFPTDSNYSPSILLMSSTSGTSPESTDDSKANSPYTVLNSIMWGNS